MEVEVAKNVSSSKRVSVGFSTWPAWLIGCMRVWAEQGHGSKPAANGSLCPRDWVQRIRTGESFLPSATEPLLRASNNLGRFMIPSQQCFLNKQSILQQPTHT